MTDTLIADRLAPVKKSHGWLERGGKTWRIPVIETHAYIGPGDDLFLGDRITFGEGLQSKRTLLLRVTFDRGRVFDSSFQQRCYELEAQVACPDCGHSAVHPVTVADVGRHQAGGSVWTFTRTCRDCGALWLQDGQRPFGDDDGMAPWPPWLAPKTQDSRESA